MMLKGCRDISLNFGVSDPCACLLRRGGLVTDVMVSPIIATIVEMRPVIVSANTLVHFSSTPPTEPTIYTRLAVALVVAVRLGAEL